MQLAKMTFDGKIDHTAKMCLINFNKKHSAAINETLAKRPSFLCASFLRAQSIWRGNWSTQRVYTGAYS